MLWCSTEMSGEVVQHIDVSNPQTPDERWLVLGVLELLLNSESENALEKWLKQLLAPLNLQSDLTNKISISAQDSLRRAQQPQPHVAYGHIQISIFTPPDYISKGKTWGSFHIEKIENADPAKKHTNHKVEFYLYREGT
jgi:hypothetical protein